MTQCRWFLPIGYVALLCASCTFDPSTRWFAPEVKPKPPPGPICKVGDRRCTDSLEACQADDSGALGWKVVEPCASEGKVCSAGLLKCVLCQPTTSFCQGQQVRRCHDDGMGSDATLSCDTAHGQACRDGACPQLCDQAAKERSNVGCEYWGADLDNAVISATLNAAAQQYAIVVSNPQPDVAATVSVYQDNGQPGGPAAPQLVTQALIPPLNLRVFKLGPREVDGSPDGTFNTGTNTALTRRAYKVTSDFPVVAFQFNPLENVNVFSNDASLLKPREALTYEGQTLALAYVVAGWPQTIAWTDDPATNFDPQDPINLRAALTLIGTEPNTHVVVYPTANIVGDDITNTGAQGPHLVPATNKGGKLDLHLDAFDTLNLETPTFGSFNADFTGTLIYADKPIAVFSGGEASDAPHFTTLSDRRCCADHLEQQLDPIRTAGKTFAVAHEPSRTEAVKAAGGDVAIAPEPNYFRFVATSDQVTTITTTLDSPDDKLQLFHVGDSVEVRSFRDFSAQADQPVHLVQLEESQDAANIPRGLPGGDPSLLVVPPIEQFRADYVFLTPDKYNFDFITVVAPATATAALDGQQLTAQLCEIRPTDGLTAAQRGGAPAFLTYACQLSFPVIDKTTGQVSPGMQNDGVHRVRADAPIGVIAWGFDAYVSYAYAAGTELRDIATPR